MKKKTKKKQPKKQPRKLTKEELEQAYNLGNFNEYLYDLVYQEAMDSVISNFDIDPDEDFDAIQKLCDEFIKGFYGD